MTFPHMHHFVIDDHFQIGILQCFLRQHNSRKERKRMHIFSGQVNLCAKQFLQAAKTDNFYGFEVPDEQIQEKYNYSECVNRQQVMIPFEGKLRFAS